MTTRIAALTALVALAVVPTASAQLPQGDTEGVQKGSSAVTGVPSALEGSVEAGSRCRTVWAGRYRKNALQIVVWRYRQEIFFCYKPNRATGGGRITYLSRTRWERTSPSGRSEGTSATRRPGTPAGATAPSRKVTSSIALGCGCASLAGSPGSE
jgi:hypothetical protein